MKAPEELLAWLREGAAFGLHFPAGSVADRALERRDNAQAEQAWLADHRSVQERIVRTPLPSGVLAAVERVAELAFRSAFVASGHHHDLAAQASDDMKLLAEAAAVGYTSAYLERLWDAYSAGEFGIP